MRLYAATGNPGKLREFRLAVQGNPAVEVEQIHGFGMIAPCREDGLTFEENAVRKARYYAEYAPGLVFADDSGLEVDALGGAPGVLSARFGGIGATDATSNRLLLQILEGVQPRTARFVCVMALVEGDQLRGVFRGAVEGLIAEASAGAQGFGYDPIFYYPPFGCTFGEVPPERKFEVSHRGQALRAMLASLKRARKKSAR